MGVNQVPFTVQELVAEQCDGQAVALVSWKAARVQIILLLPSALLRARTAGTPDMACRACLCDGEF